MSLTKQNTYSSAISAEKKEDFSIFLQQLGVSEEEVDFDEDGRGDYILYTIDFSKKEEFEIRHIRDELINSLVDFL